MSEAGLLSPDLEQPAAPKAAAGLMPRSGVWVAVLLFLFILVGFALYDLVLREAPAPTTAPRAAAAASGNAAAQAPTLGTAPPATDIQTLVDSQVAKAAPSPSASASAPTSAAGRPPVPSGLPEAADTEAGDAVELPAATRPPERGARVERMAEATTSQIFASTESAGGEAGAAGALAARSPADLLRGMTAASEPSAASSRSPEVDLLRGYAQAQNQTSTRSGRDEAWLKDMSQAKAADAVWAENPASPWIVFQGTRIPVVTREALNSDLPGPITAIATAPVYDSIRQCALMVPQGTRFIGQYNSDIHAGQSRVLLAFRRMILPDGRSVELGGAQGVDAIGQAGMGGDVDNHFLQMFGYGFAMAWISSKLGGGDGASVTVTQSNGQSTRTTVAGQILSETANRVLSRNAVIPPTITVDIGARLYVTVTRDMALTPLNKGLCS